MKKIVTLYHQEEESRTHKGVSLLIELQLLIFDNGCKFVVNVMRVKHKLLYDDLKTLYSFVFDKLQDVPETYMGVFKENVRRRVDEECRDVSRYSDYEIVYR